MIAILTENLIVYFLLVFSLYSGQREWRGICESKKKRRKKKIHPTPGYNYHS